MVKKLNILTSSLGMTTGTEFKLYRGEAKDGQPILSCIMRKESGRMACCVNTISISGALSGNEKYVIVRLPKVSIATLRGRPLKG